MKKLTSEDLVFDIIEHIDGVVPDASEYERSEDRNDYIANGVENIMYSKWSDEEIDAYENMQNEVIEGVKKWIERKSASPKRKKR